MKKNFKWPNSQGFTITELLIAVGLTTIVGLGVFQVLTNSSQMSKALSEKLDERVESKLGDKLLVRDIRSAGPSLNNIYAKDDSGYNFFDYEMDRSSNFYRNQKKKSRTITLVKGGITSFYFLTADSLRGRGLFADAITFFEVGATPSSPYTPASLTYRGINYNNYLSALDKEGKPLNNPELISTENLGKLILVDSSSYMPTEPLRPAVFIGRVVKSGSIYDIQKIESSSIPKNNSRPIFNYDIRTPTLGTTTPNTFEQYMYNLPPLGANGASVRVKPVRLFKYELDCVSDPTCVLYRQDVLHGASTQKVPVLRGFPKITFIRSDIATSVFEVEVDNGKGTTSTPPVE